MGAVRAGGGLREKADTWSLVPLPPSPPRHLPQRMELLPRSRGPGRSSRRALVSSLRESTAVQMPGSSPFTDVDARGMARGQRTRRHRHQDRAGGAITATGGGWRREPWMEEAGERARATSSPAQETGWALSSQGAPVCSPPCQPQGLRLCWSLYPTHVLSFPFEILGPMLSLLKGLSEQAQALVQKLGTLRPRKRKDLLTST